MMIRFGTSGWRGLMGEEFTFHNVRVVVQAIANHLREKFAGKPIAVAVGYDTRFLSERYALEASKLLSKNEISVYLADRDAPSQALAFQVIKRRCQGAVNFTASFNPPWYNGLKFNVETGAPALPEVTDRIEEEVRTLMPGFSHVPVYAPKENISRIDLQSDYLCFIQDKIDFETIRRAGTRVAVDLLYGTSREYLDEVLEENDIPLEGIHGYIDPYFGGVNPSCTEDNLAELKTLVRETKCHLGIATDGDGDRIAARHELPLYKTKVGFKYMADLFLKGHIVFGGEESACIAVKDHLPEKDGIFAGLLVAEMVSATGKGLRELREDLFKEYGTVVGGQRTVPLTPERAKKLKTLVENPPLKIGRRKAVEAETIDGVKLGFEGGDWVLLRVSGTEPLIRCYAESATKKGLDDLLKNGMEAVL
jgi:phosphoglucomutase